MTEAGTSPLLPLPFIPLPELAETLRHWQRPEPGQQDFTLQLGVTSTSWTMDLGSLWIKSILTTKPTLQIPMDKDRLQERAALSSPYHLSWASLRFAIGRLFSLDNHYLIRGWFPFVTGDTHSQLQPH
ncbi:hypothetical protein CEP52_012331 [Fusarium oligoseptatum]|uniref:Uncharacterized protein n=1 Tax=Fusarium oligoseptatum TaxID=2604345 RepID=A0A428SYU4_9HYPO|nr:hypothetical protein CEP52_012331 [Fusarium oligoseptatum]